MTRSSVLIAVLPLLSFTAGCYDHRSIPSRESPEITASEAEPVLWYLGVPDARRDGLWLDNLEDGTTVFRRLDGEDVTDLFTVEAGYATSFASLADDDVVIGLDGEKLLRFRDGDVEDLTPRLAAVLAALGPHENMSVLKVNVAADGTVVAMVDSKRADGLPDTGVCRLSDGGDTFDNELDIVAGSMVELAFGANAVVEGAGGTWALYGNSLHRREQGGSWARVTDDPVVQLNALDDGGVAWAEALDQYGTSARIHVTGADGTEKQLGGALDLSVADEHFYGHAPAGLWRITAEGEQQITPCVVGNCSEPYLWVQLVIHHTDEGGEREVGHIDLSPADLESPYSFPRLSVLPLSDGGLRIELDGTTVYSVPAP